MSIDYLDTNIGLAGRHISRRRHAALEGAQDRPRLPCTLFLQCYARSISCIGAQGGVRSGTGPAPSGLDWPERRTDDFIGRDSIILRRAFDGAINLSQQSPSPSCSARANPVRWLVAWQSLPCGHRQHWLYSMGEGMRTDEAIHIRVHSLDPGQRTVALRYHL